MTKKVCTKRALLMSALSLLLCISMLIGSTFAWFTDSVTSGNNKIVAGNLDVVLEYSTDGDTWNAVETTSKVFNDNTLWEPGHREVVMFRVRNAGTLHLKYEMLTTVIEEKGSINVYGDEFELSDYLTLEAFSYSKEALGFDQMVDNFFDSRDVWFQMDEFKFGENMKVNGSTQEMAPGYEHYYFVAITMPETVGNEANYATGNDAPYINFAINLVATQSTYESDSFDNQYDKDASFPVLASAQTIKGAFKTSDGTDITKKISNIIFGKPADYPEITANYTGTVDGDLTVYQVLNNDNASYTIYYLSDGKVSLPANSKNLFADMSGLKEMDTSNLDMSKVENALCMFANCTNLEKLDTAGWDTSNMTNMQSLFYGCNNLENINVSNWDTSNVTNMRMVFFRCYELSNDILKGVENWDVSNVTNFYSMFKHARGLTSLDLSKWDTSSATTMSHMFANIGGVEELDLSGFDTSKVTDMSWMFYDASKLTTIYVGDGWTTEAVTTTTHPFYNNQVLVGEKGTTWLDVCDMANPNRPWESSAKLEYAIVDGGTTAPGLLTYKAN